MNHLRATGLVILALTSTAAATPKDDLAFAVGESNHDKQSSWIIDRLVTLKLGDKCWAKVLDPKNHALAMMASFTRTIQRFAKATTGDDWYDIESSTANNKETNRGLVDKLITGFTSSFHLTVTVEGDDCDASGNALWLNYISVTVHALSTYPPKTKKAFVTIDMTEKAKTATVTVSKDGSTFAIVGGRDRQDGPWAGVIEKALKRVSSKD